MKSQSLSLVEGAVKQDTQLERDPKLELVMMSPVYADGTNIRHVGVQHEKELQHEDGDEVANPQVAKYFTIHHGLASERKDGSETNIE